MSTGVQHVVAGREGAQIRLQENVDVLAVDRAAGEEECEGRLESRFDAPQRRRGRRDCGERKVEMGSVVSGRPLVDLWTLGASRPSPFSTPYPLRALCVSTVNP